MKQRRVLVLLVGMLALQGCAISSGVGPFKPVNLNGDLSAATLARYRGEAEQARRTGQGGHLLTLEGTNWWPLGLLAYWRQGTVAAIHGPTGRMVYVVSQSRGYGPLSVLYVTQRGATFADDGCFVSGTKTGSVLWGHLAMLHSMTAGHAGGGHVHRSLGLLHHLVNLGWGHDGFSLSLFSAPNPVGFGT